MNIFDQTVLAELLRQHRRADICDRLRGPEAVRGNRTGTSGTTTARRADPIFKTNPDPGLCTPERCEIIKFIFRAYYKKKIARASPRGGTFLFPLLLEIGPSIVVVAF